MKSILILIASLSVCFGQAKEGLHIGDIEYSGKVYRACDITEVTPAFIKVKSKDGEVVMFIHLLPEDKKTVYFSDYNFDSAKIWYDEFKSKNTKTAQAPVSDKVESYAVGKTYDIYMQDGTKKVFTISSISSTGLYGTHEGKSTTISYKTMHLNSLKIAAPDEYKKIVNDIRKFYIGAFYLDDLSKAKEDDYRKNNLFYENYPLANIRRSSENPQIKEFIATYKINSKTFGVDISINISSYSDHKIRMDISTGVLNIKDADTDAIKKLIGRAIGDPNKNINVSGRIILLNGEVFNIPRDHNEFFIKVDFSRISL